MRRVFGLVAGLVVWTVVASLGERLLRAAWPAYAAAAPTLDYDLAMRLARLALGAVSTLAAGAAVALVAGARSGDAQRWFGQPVHWLGIALLIVFLPMHARLWHAFPLWYHLAFLGSLWPLVIAGARLTPSRRASA